MVLNMVSVRISKFSIPRFGPPAVLFFITSKRIELKSWDWSCCKDKFKWIMHLSTAYKYFENLVIKGVSIKSFERTKYAREMRFFAFY